MRYPLLCAVALLASGCALPIPLQIASWAASGISYIATGKSISDHAVSAVTSQDCAMHRIALGEHMCHTIETDGIAIAANGPAAAETKPAEPTQRLRKSMIALAQNIDSDFQPASDDPAAPKPLDSALLAMADTLNSIDRKTLSSVAPDRDGGKHYLVIGRYNALDEAEKVMERHTELGTKLRMVLEGGVLLYQVTAGPFTRHDAQDLEADFKKNDDSTHVALLCADGVTPAPCNEAPVQLTEMRTPHSN